jgi:hypothetical protein
MAGQLAASMVALWAGLKAGQKVDLMADLTESQ